VTRGVQEEQGKEQGVRARGSEGEEEEEE